MLIFVYLGASGGVITVHTHPSTLHIDLDNRFDLFVEFYRISNTNTQKKTWNFRRTKKLEEIEIWREREKERHTHTIYYHQ